jgi:hypothetical protein
MFAPYYLFIYLHKSAAQLGISTNSQVVELSQRLREMQNDFKEVHKQVEQVRQTGSRPSELKADIATLVHPLSLNIYIHTFIHTYIHTYIHIISQEQESTQLKNKIQKMKKDMNVDEAYFRDMLNVRPPL